MTKTLRKRVQVQVKNEEEGRPDCCNNCGGSNIVKNGRYSVKNHLALILGIFLPFLNTEKEIQRWLCTDYGHSVKDETYRRHVTIRDTLILAIGQLAFILVFKHGLSIRAVSDILRRVFGFNCSLGYIHKICKQAGKNAKRLSHLVAG